MLTGVPEVEKREDELETIFEEMAVKFSLNAFTEFSSDMSVHKFKISNESQQDK